MAIYRTTIAASQDGQTIDTIMGWETPGAATVADATSLATAVAIGWQGQVMVDLVDDYVMGSVECFAVDDPTVGVLVASTDAGDVAGDPMPMFCVANTRLITGLRGRSYSGRFGIPGLLHTMIDTTNGNRLTSSALATLQADVESFRTYVEASATDPVMAVVSTISGGTPRPAPIATPVVSLAVQASLGSRVSRKG